MEKYQWKNRVLLIFSDDKTDEKLQQQIINLSKDKKGLIERKLKIYQFVKDEFTTDFKADWSLKTIKTQNFKKESESFKVVLIGLDGGIKLKQDNVLSTEKLFTIIDGMPMRRRELKQKN
ncbi:DUF4174 domain-containing protein [Polaribacter sp.]|uniref:DUF4174 domain-containing protein n=1 Tax=Polaribacter sp. TaxID=1920175 RepID=UPI003F6CBF76